MLDVKEERFTIKFIPHADLSYWRSISSAFIEEWRNANKKKNHILFFV